MPVTINGDGSIAGLSVGGLPDGCVDTDTLASGAATQAKRTYAAGEIVQTVTTNTSSQVDITSSSYIDSNVTATITPKFNNSKILVISQLCWDNPSDGVFAGKLLRGSLDIKEEVYWGFCNAGPNGGGTSYTVSRNAHYHLDDPTTLSPTVYKWQVKRVSGSSTGYINYNDGTGETDSQIILHEIKV